MLPHNLIYGSLVVGLVTALAVIGSDSKQLSGIRNLFTGQDNLARFQRLYLPGFLLAMLADWLQGASVYALYPGPGLDRAPDAPDAPDARLTPFLLCLYFSPIYHIHTVLRTR